MINRAGRVRVQDPVQRGKKTNKNELYGGLLGVRSRGKRGARMPDKGRVYYENTTKSGWWCALAPDKPVKLTLMPGQSVHYCTDLGKAKNVAADQLSAKAGIQ